MYSVKTDIQRFLQAMYIYAKQRTAGLPLHPLFCCISGGYHNRTSKTDLGFAGRTRLPDIPTDCHSSSHQRQGRTKIRGNCFKKGQGYFLDAGRREKNARISGTERPEDDMEWVVYAL
ncbi:hypothetical protein A4V08_10170 [Lachnoclostridium sp. YL32]|nr:hypothetical protein A4V08_10170 [Lachnoclostridium sp. YL32]